MRIHKQFFKSVAFATLLSSGFAANAIAQDTSTIVDPEIKAPVIVTTSPNGGEMNVSLGSVIEITFSNEMDGESINGSTLLMHATSIDTTREYRSEVMMDDQIRDRSETKRSNNNWQSSTGAISGTISYSNKVALFTPDTELKEGTLYTFTVTSGVHDLDNIAIENAQDWSFTTTGAPDTAYFDNANQNKRYAMAGPEINSMYASKTTKSVKIIDLGTAENYVMLAKKDVKNDSSSSITGDIGEGSAVKNSQKETRMSNSEQKSTTGKSLGMRSSKNDTASADVTEALKDMMSAHADAAMLNGDDVTTHNTKSFHHEPVLAPGVHEWNDSLQVTSDVTLSGSADDVWIFKTSNTLTINENTVFTLSDGARAENIFWYAEGEVIIGKNVQLEGIIMSTNEITLEEGAKLNGRMFSQMSITLDDNTVTEPRSMTGQTTSTNE